jgi:hypothetical protein
MKKRRHVLVIGPTCGGKTHLAGYFEKRGKVAFDCDSFPGLARTVDLEGNPKEPTAKEWRTWSGIKWVWNREKIEELLAANPEAYLFGTADNMYEFKSLFDELYYLDIGRELILKRLRSKARENRFGRFPKQRERVLNTLDYFAADAKKHGFRFIDASLSPAEIFRMICGRSRASGES